jgi:hypothetical protein
MRRWMLSMEAKPQTAPFRPWAFFKGGRDAENSRQKAVGSRQ